MTSLIAFGPEDIWTNVPASRRCSLQPFTSLQVSLLALLSFSPSPGAILRCESEASITHGVRVHLLVFLFFFWADNYYLHPFFFYFFFSILDTILLVQQYSKTQALTGKDSAICRFLPKELARVVAIALCYVKPLEAVIAKEVHGAEAAITTRTFLFVRHGERMSEEVIRDSVASAFRSRGIPLLFSDYRFGFFSSSFVVANWPVLMANTHSLSFSFSDMSRLPS